MKGDNKRQQRQKKQKDEEVPGTSASGPPRPYRYAISPPIWGSVDFLTLAPPVVRHGGGSGSEQVLPSSTYRQQRHQPARSRDRFKRSPLDPS
ncbi:hypothetical protein MGYG_01097 [Nannizzia gypsea CBS 118893]|uniref:Uncharacterized protein n=1 Tax=Arthroderma gypseum (strain ATCC MYA-4604 / CBS 118893) TaxID=535722 RepID=E5QYI4_ARTGP|nr:hypothetical protein MGYG_01097 [Nannizzia gypsea CBS 118893]EFQ98060.1 hypothetical protein MGYG_01097 [Nannizzia gypsea CBS 118893]